MSELNKDHDNIPESKAARWAYRLSRIPFLGLAIYFVLAPIALYRIGSKGRTGFHLLSRGLFFGIMYSVLLYSILFITAFGPTWAFPFVYKHGYEITFHDNGNIEEIIPYYWGTKHGKKILWNENGQKWFEHEFKDGELHGKGIRWDENGQKKDEVDYKDGELITIREDTIEYEPECD